MLSKGENAETSQAGRNNRFTLQRKLAEKFQRQTAA